MIPIAAIATLQLPKWWLVMIPIVALLLLQLPMAVAMTKRAGPAMLAFIVLGAIRAVYRAVGMWHGVIDRVTSFVMASGRKP